MHAANIQDNRGAVPLLGTATNVPAPVASLSPASLTFAGQVVGSTSAAKSVTLSNTGNASLSVTSVTVSGPFAITSNSWYNTYIAPWRSSISTKMQACATSGYYYEVSSDSSITDALNALFQKAIAASHLTN